MLKKQENRLKNCPQIVSIEDLVPKNHILRKINLAIDFSFIYEEINPLYCLDNGRPSVDPVVLFKMIMIQYLFGIRSMRQTAKEIEVNMAYRWFLGYDLMEQTPHFSTFSKNYCHRFQGTDIFDKIFAKILEEAISCNFVDTSAVFIDATHIKACANKKKAVNERVKVEAKHYKKRLQEEINQDREEHDKKPFDDDDHPPEEKNTKVSTTDPESGLFHKGEHQKCFAYSAHTACCKNNFILDTYVTPGNIHDSVAFDNLYNSLKNNFTVSSVVMDVGYKTPWICKQVFDDGKLAILPYKRPMTKFGFFKKYEFVYDDYYDCYICPNDKILNYSTTNREGYREYKSKCYDCKGCPNLSKCTNSKNKVKVITRHIWEKYIDEAEHVRHTDLGKELYSLRSQTIERVFGDAKEKQGMRYTQFKGLNKVRIQALLTFACQNLKKLTKMKERNGYFSSFFCLFLWITSIYSKKAKSLSLNSKTALS